PLVRFAQLDAQVNVYGPAVKLWNTAVGATMMREAVNLMGGYGITEDCPGFVGQKWMDAQLEATYEGPESVQRRQLSVTMLNEVFLAQLRVWLKEMREIGRERAGTGACALATGLELWLKTLEYLQSAKDASGGRLYSNNRQGVTFALADALCWLLSSRSLILDVIELEERGVENPVLAEGLDGLVAFYTDLSHAQVARSCGEAGRICAELIYGYQRHPAWDDADNNGSCRAQDADALDAIIPGIGAGVRGYGDVLEMDELRPNKAGPCFVPHGIDGFIRLRAKLDGCLCGCRLAKDRAAAALTKVMIPETLDYPI
ncbi:MAG TPA: acyl-CoA dehydrogenase family protein, partial [Oligoflexia bacterium]|nr:acyl-CoA dehydrogenase family protein [Oligoflexia bacterium]